MYIYDTDNEIHNRMQQFGEAQEAKLSEGIVRIIKDVLDINNELVKIFRTARDVCSSDNIVSFDVCLYKSGRQVSYDRPAPNTMGAIVHEGVSGAKDFDIIIRHKDGRPQRINKLNSLYMALQYPLLHIFGDRGWSPDMCLTVHSGRKNIRLTLNMYYSFIMHDRHYHYSLILRSGRLFQQYLVDAYICIEQNRLDYVRLNQNLFRTEFLQGVHDAIAKGDTEGRSVGKCVILPSSFTGGPRYMYKHYHDALAICRVYGNPQFFITFTCNVKWQEIVRYMTQFPSFKAQDKPDIVCRVFNLKVEAFRAFVKCERLFGNIVADLYTIEFQKRGLPHCHMLFWVSPADKIITADDVDRHISAEIPNPDTDSELYKIVSECMIHGPCGLARPNAPCMDGGVCSKGFPKRYQASTTFDKNGYIKYKRSAYGFSVKKNDIDVDNAYVVPYNRTLSLLFNAQINVEYCGWNMMIKYLFKLAYIHPSFGESFFLRMLLNHQTGCKSFADVRTFDGVIYDTYRSACEKLGLLVDDNEWLLALDEVKAWATPKELRALFAHILLHCEVTNPLRLWENQCRSMSDDIIRNTEIFGGDIGDNVSDETLSQYLLYELEFLLNSHSTDSSLKKFGLPMPNTELIRSLRNRLLMEEKNYDREHLLKQHQGYLQQLHPQQHAVYDHMVSALESNTQVLAFVYGHGGTVSRKNSLGCSGPVIASLLFPGGRIAHSRFKIPIDLTDHSNCNISKSSYLSQLLVETELIIWDEAPMSNRKCFEALDMTLKDILNNSQQSFSGKKHARQWFNTATGGSMLDKLTIEEAKEMFESIALADQHTPSRRSVSAAKAAAIASSRGVHHFDQNARLSAQLEELTKEVRDLKLQRKCEICHKNHETANCLVDSQEEVAFQNLKDKFGELSAKIDQRPSGSLPSDTVPNPGPTYSKPFPNAHAKAVTTRSGRGVVSSAPREEKEFDEELELEMPPDKVNRRRDPASTSQSSGASVEKEKQVE
ncbi:uncharacterized protein LOC143625563 [Bidens hawaiensis]|uniref:uncharacterized protein LOC143625563 n=1 Tax=Bidens hawaiensis TaxID=980011 RepID=UPI00404B8C1B